MRDTSHGKVYPRFRENDSCEIEAGLAIGFFPFYYLQLKKLGF